MYKRLYFFLLQFIFIVEIFFFTHKINAQCLGANSLSVSPQPNGSGQYYPNTTVNFCFTISNWTQTNQNWLEAVIPTFGSGWDLSTLTYVGLPGAGGWIWYNNGWHVDKDANGDPNNDFGDASTGPWTFCWQITTASQANCVTGSSLACTIDSYSDGDLGIWTDPNGGSSACNGDPIYTFNATINCTPPPPPPPCPTPTLNTTPATCFVTWQGPTDGSVTTTISSSNAPYDFVFTNASGVIII